MKKLYYVQRSKLIDIIAIIAMILGIVLVLAFNMVELKIISHLLREIGIML